MKPAPFDYVAAKTVEDASAALAADGASAAVIAGGQSLVPMLALRVALPDVLVDISGIAALRETHETPAGLRIGALVTHADIEDGRIPDLFGGLMQHVASGISYRAIRNYGTIGGSVALADPAADWPVCLAALGAEVRIAGGSATRSERIADFIHGQYATSLSKDEIVVGFDVPRPAGPLRWGLHKVARKSGAFAESFAVAVADRDAGTVSIALGGAVPCPFLLPATAEHVGSAATSGNALRAAIAQDLKAGAPDADGYQVRLHSSTILRALREMFSR